MQLKRVHYVTTEKKDELSMVMKKHYVGLSIVFFAVLSVTSLPAFSDATSRSQAKRMHDRLTGVVPSPSVLTQMEDAIDANNAVGAAYIAMKNKHFYNATLVNFITPWTNEARAVFPEDMEQVGAQPAQGTLNDYTATVIGAIRDDVDFRHILYDDILYVGAGSLGLTNTYSYSSNAHYKELEDKGFNLGDSNVLVPVSQASQTGGVLTPADTAGVITTRAGAKAFFVDGTNRAMFRFTVLNHLCKDMEQLKDVTLPSDRIRQDVSRSPGGDSRIFMNACIGCHTGMDPMTQAFAYYDYDESSGKLAFTPGSVQGKNLINSDNFKPGYITTNDSWVNYWRQGSNSLLNWDSSLPGKGNGAKSMAQELAHSEQFARCQVEKVFKSVCLRPPGNSADRTEVNNILANFKLPFNNAGYELKRVFAETAVYCMGQ
ncbi:MAG: hypothetical protein OEW97_01770 [Gammaproteobacteria bacterium]|nr:hypothetical protein [Gammaproteobacteria bacterium]